MKKAIKDLLASKKFLVTLVAIIVAVGGKFGLDLNTETVISIVGPLMGFVLGQGLADFGKEKAKIEAGADRSDE